MVRWISALALAVAVAGPALGGCGGSVGADEASAAQVTAAVGAAAQELDPEVPRDSGADRDAAVSRFMGLLNALHEARAHPPLFDRYDVPYPAVADGEGRGEGLLELLRAVRIATVSGVVYVTNRATGSVIYAAPETDLGRGTLDATGLPTAGEQPPPPGAVACMSFAYSAWGSCRTDGTSSRTVLASSPSGCAGGAPVTTRPCAFTPRPIGP